MSLRCCISCLGFQTNSFLLWKNIRTNKKTEGLDEDLPFFCFADLCTSLIVGVGPNLKCFTNFEPFPFLLVVGVLPKLMSTDLLVSFSSHIIFT